MHHRICLSDTSIWAFLILVILRVHFLSGKWFLIGNLAIKVCVRTASNF